MPFGWSLGDVEGSHRRYFQEDRLRSHSQAPLSGKSKAAVEIGKRGKPRSGTQCTHAVGRSGQSSCPRGKLERQAEKTAG